LEISPSPIAPIIISQITIVLESNEWKINEINLKFKIIRKFINEI